MTTMTTTKLPKWFKGDVYHKGNTVTNPFSGQEVYLNRYELSMYDFIKGAEYVLNAPHYQDHDRLSKLSKEFDKALRWFSKNNINAYMALLD